MRRFLIAALIVMSLAQSAEGANDMKIAISVQRWTPTEEANKVKATITGAGSYGTRRLDLEGEEILIDLSGSKAGNQTELRAKAAERANAQFPGLGATAADVELF